MIRAALEFLVLAIIAGTILNFAVNAIAMAFGIPVSCH